MASNLSNLLFALKNKPLQIGVVSCICGCDCMPQMQSDCKNHFWFVIEELSGILRALWLSANLSTSDRDRQCDRARSRTCRFGYNAQLTRRICRSRLQIQNNFENRFLFQNYHQILTISFKEAFYGNSENNFDCRASVFEIVTGSRISEILRRFMHKVGEFVSCRSTMNNSLESFG